MMHLARAYAIALNGLRGTPVEVQTHIGPGIVGTTLVGLPDASLREAKERVRAALFSCGVATLNRRVTVNLSPADLPKTGSSFDVAIAISLLVARGLLDPAVTDGTVFVAELGLDGSLQPVPGVLPATMAAKEHGFKKVVMPPSLIAEGLLVDGIQVVACAHLSDVITVFAPVKESEKDLFGDISTGARWEEIGRLAERISSFQLAAARAREGAGFQGGSSVLAGKGPDANDHATKGFDPGGFGARGSNPGTFNPDGFGLSDHTTNDIADVRGQSDVVEALAVAAVGAHHVLLHGPPGIGKTMLAARLADVLPDLSREDSLTVTALHSLAASADAPRSLSTRPPLQMPHHSATLVSLIGGGAPIRPGAVSLAHAGVLVLDEAPEFQARTLDALRQPLEVAEVAIHRARSRVLFPARFQLVMTANPCPCGGESEGDQPSCTCSWSKKRKYWARLSGPLLDRVDLHLAVKRPHRQKLVSDKPISTDELRARVHVARERSARRLRDTPWHLNSQVPGRYLRQNPAISGAYLRSLDRSVDRGLISLRGADRILRVAWSIADLAGNSEPTAEDFALASNLRSTPVR